MALPRERKSVVARTVADLSAKSALRELSSEFCSAEGPALVSVSSDGAKRRSFVQAASRRAQQRRVRTFMEHRFLL
jgi:hypothetical protein